MFLFTLINNRWLEKLWPGTSYMSHVQLKPIHGAAVTVWMMQLHVWFSRHTSRIMQNSTVELLVQMTLRRTLKMVNMSKTGPEGTLNDLCFSILNDVMTHQCKQLPSSITKAMYQEQTSWYTYWWYHPAVQQRLSPCAVEGVQTFCI